MKKLTSRQQRSSFGIENYFHKRRYSKMNKGTLRRLTVGLLTCSMLASSSLLLAEEAKAAPSIDQVVRTFSERITGLYKRGEYRQAALATVEYEQSLLRRYSPPTYELGLLQSEKEHLSIYVSFDSWRQKSEIEMDIPKELEMMGISVLLALEGSSETESMGIMSWDLSQIERRMGGSDGFSVTSDRGLQMMGQMMASQFGTVRSQRFRTIGDHRVLWLEIVTPMMGPDVRLAILPQSGRVFAFLLTSAASNIEENENKLKDTIKTASFDYKPSDDAAVVAAREKRPGSDVESRLSCAGRLAELGEYNAAAKELAELNLSLYEQMPGPVVKGDVGSLPAYGVTVKNPDPERWALSTEVDGLSQSIVLEDRSSVQGEGIMVGVMDFIATYGPKVVALMMNEEIKRTTLRDSGRGVGMMLGRIEDEKFVTIRGSLAYEAIVAVNMPGLKARLQVIDQQGVSILVLAFVRASKFQEQMAKYNEIINSHVKWGKPEP